MNRIKRRSSEYFRKHVRKVIDAFSNASDKGVYIEVETTVSNEELCEEIRLNIDYLNKLIKVAKKRNIKVILNVGPWGMPVEIDNTKVDICETKRY